MVLVLHASQNFPTAWTDVALVHHGYLGVDLFFILSGFIITHVYLREMVSLRPRAIVVFLWLRFIRLFPAHATVLAGLVALVTLARNAGFSFADPKSWNLEDLPAHFLMVHAWGVTKVAGWNAPSWSISAEWFAYLLFPMIALAISRPGHATALLLAFASLAGGAALFEALGWTLSAAWIGWPALVRVTSEFLCGALLCRAVAGKAASSTPLRSDVLAFGGLLLFVAGASANVNIFILIGLLMPLIAGVSGTGRGVQALFGNRTIIWVGEISYSIYIVHFPVLLILRHSAEKAGLPLAESEPLRLLMFSFGIAAAIAAAALLFYAVERPVRVRCRDLFGRIPRQPPS
jgi:peptidoglycan/LPS O-acetylase OafA/YrhL